jgi:type IV pilus assembly protein PilW
MRTYLNPIERQRGVTLTELMIALVVGALVVLAATAMVVASRGTYRTQDETTRLAESSRFALELGNRMIRLAGYTNFGNPNYNDPESPPPNYVQDTLWAASPDAYSLDGPQIVGANNSKPGGGSGLNGSDSLTIRFFGSNSTTGVADGNVLDCAGTAVPEPKANITTANRDQVNRQSRAYNVLFIDTDPDGEPALKCQRQTFTAAGVPSGLPGDTQTLIRGVEDFQVLYGEAIPQPAPNDDLDLSPPASIVYRTGIGGPNPVGNWANIRTVRIAMLLRSGTGALPSPELTTTTYNLFGTYPSTGSDTGTRFSLSSLSVSDRTRARRVVETTVFVRNRMRDWTSVNVN